MKLTQEQLDFLTGKVAARSPKDWMPLLEAGLIYPNAGAPPMFLLTAKGMELFSEEQLADQERQVHIEITGITV